MDQIKGKRKENCQDKIEESFFFVLNEKIRFKGCYLRRDYFNSTK